MIDIVIVNWNSGNYLKNCVESIQTNTYFDLVSSIIIVDNNSEDNSLNMLASKEKLLIIQNLQNYGFARACNQGFSISSAKYVLLLNPDTKIFDSTLNQCVTFLSFHPEIDILGCQFLNEQNDIYPNCSRFPKARHFWNESLGLSKLLPRFFKPPLIMLDWGHTESRFVDQVMGAFMFMRRSIFDQVGYFDERFFVYYEEVDFAKRLSNINGKSFFNADIKIFHAGKGTTEKIKAARQAYSISSRLKYFKKHFSLLSNISIWLVTWLIEPFSKSLYYVISGRPSQLLSLWKAYFLVIKNYGKY